MEYLFRDLVNRIVKVSGTYEGKWRRWSSVAGAPCELDVKAWGGLRTSSNSMDRQEHNRGHGGGTQLIK